MPVLVQTACAALAAMALLFNFTTARIVDIQQSDAIVYHVEVKEKNKTIPTAIEYKKGAIKISWNRDNKGSSLTYERGEYVDINEVDLRIIDTALKEVQKGSQGKVRRIVTEFRDWCNKLK